MKHDHHLANDHATRIRLERVARAVAASFWADGCAVVPKGWDRPVAVDLDDAFVALLSDATEAIVAEAATVVIDGRDVKIVRAWSGHLHLCLIGPANRTMSMDDLALLSAAADAAAALIERRRSVPADLPTPQAGLMRTALDHMDQGIMVVEPDLSVSVLSRRAAELIGLPCHFADDPPGFADILDEMCRRGIITEGVRDGSINAYILRREELPTTHVYERETFDGRWLEVRTTRLPAGGFVRTFTDQTQRALQNREIEHAHAEYRALFENSVTGIYRVTNDDTRLQANPAFARLNGYRSVSEVEGEVGRFIAEWYVEPARRGELERLLRRDGRVSDFVSEVFRLASGERVWVSETAWAIRDDAGQVIGYEGTVTDATERKRAEEAMLHLARHDDLTGLANRFLLMDRLTELCLGPKRDFTLMCLDLDHFKIVNDTLGHPAGDRLLSLVAKRVETVIREEDMFARVGGDEFCLIMADATRQDAERASARLIRAIGSPYTISGTEVIVGCSIGIAFGRGGADDPLDLTARADIALYKAKNRGRNLAVLETPDRAAHHLAGGREAV